MAATLTNAYWILHPPAHVRRCDADVHVSEDKLGGPEIEPQQLEEAIYKVADFDGQHVGEKTQPIHG